MNMTAKKSLLIIYKRAFMLILCVLFGIGTQVFAEQNDPNKQTDFFEMSLEELMEVPVVVSASRLRE
jgi:ABC-type phosphate transport system permease subunit